jgi:biotin transport system substrate-specific component
MAAAMTTSNTLLETFQPRSQAARLASNVVLVVLGTALLTLSAKINVPVWPVPVTLQTAAVAVLAAAFGWRIGVATVAAYILEGLAGLPVFAGAVAGPANLRGPTAGFIVSWLAMAAIIGVTADRGLSRRMLPLFAVMLLGDAVSFAVGYGWLVTVLANLKGVGIGDVLGGAFDGAIKPFVVWEILKMGLAAVTISAAWAAFRKRP